MAVRLLPTPAKLHSSMGDAHRGIRNAHDRFGSGSAPRLEDVQKIQRQIGHIRRGIKVTKVVDPYLREKFGLLEDDLRILNTRCRIAAKKRLLPPPQAEGRKPFIGRLVDIPALALHVLQFLDVDAHARLAACCNDTCTLVDSFRQKYPLLKPIDSDQSREITASSHEFYISSPLLRDRWNVDFRLLHRYAIGQERYSQHVEMYDPTDKELRKTKEVSQFKAMMIPFCDHLDELCLDDFDFYYGDPKKLPKQLKHLILSKTNAVDVEHILELLKSGQGISALTVSETGAAGLEELIKIIAQLPHLEFLDLEGKYWGVQNADPVLHAICKHCPKFRHLVLGGYLSDELPIQGTISCTDSVTIPYRAVGSNSCSNYSSDAMHALHQTFGDRLTVEWVMPLRHFKNGSITMRFRIDFSDTDKVTHHAKPFIK